MYFDLSTLAEVMTEAVIQHQSLRNYTPGNSSGKSIEQGRHDAHHVFGSGKIHSRSYFANDQHGPQRSADQAKIDDHLYLVRIRFILEVSCSIDHVTDAYTSCKYNIYLCQVQEVILHEDLPIK